jgi:hypothetical protein
MEHDQTARSLPIVGAWNLLSFEARTESGEVRQPLGPSPQGNLLYMASGRFAVQITRRGRLHSASADPLEVTASEALAAYLGVIAYYGAYTFDAAGGFVLHHIEASVYPNWEGVDLKRFYELAGDRLTLTTPPTLWGGKIVGTLKWERIG